MAESSTSLQHSTSIDAIISDHIHYDGRKFRNVWSEFTPPSFGTLWRFLRTTEREILPDQEELRRLFPATEVQRSRISAPPAGVQATFVGHATVLVQISSKDKVWNVLTDPVYSDLAGQLGVGQRRFTPVPRGLDLAELPPIDVVVISHNHYDHLDKETIRRIFELAGMRCVFLVPLGVKPLFLSLGIPADRVHELDWMEAVVLERPRDTVSVAQRLDSVARWQHADPAADQLAAVFTPAQHWSQRGLTDRCKSLWGSWVLHAAGGRAFFAGDSGYCGVFAEIGDRFGPFDLSLLPTGAYVTPSPSVHMSPVEACRIHRELRARVSMAIHFGTFGNRKFGFRPIRSVKEDVARSRAQHGLTEQTFVLPRHGETVHIPHDEKSI